jgi:hypothetical protein
MDTQEKGKLTDPRPTFEASTPLWFLGTRGIMGGSCVYLIEYIMLWCSDGCIINIASMKYIVGSSIVSIQCGMVLSCATIRYIF